MYLRRHDLRRVRHRQHFRHDHLRSKYLKHFLYAYLFEIEEKIKGEITKDNEFKRLEIKGEGFITLLNPSKCKSFLLLNCKEKVKFTTSKINKNLLNEKNIIQAEVIFIFYI